MSILNRSTNKSNITNTIFDNPNELIRGQMLQDALINIADSYVNRIDEANYLGLQTYKTTNRTYNVGDTCVYTVSGTTGLYLCTGSTSGTFDPTKWTLISTSGGGGGAVPTISLTYPSGNPTTNIALSQYFEFTFVSANPILVGSTSGTALANGASSNLNSLLTVRKEGTPITSYSATYNLIQKKIIIDIVPTGFMDENTVYEIVIDGAYNSSGACSLLTYSFTTSLQQLNISTSTPQTITSLIDGYDMDISETFNLIMVGSRNACKVNFVDLNTFNLLTTDITVSTTPDSTVVGSVGYSDRLNLLIVSIQNPSDTYTFKIYEIARIGTAEPTYTLKGSIATSGSQLPSNDTQIAIVDYSGNIYVYVATGTNIFKYLLNTSGSYTFTLQNTFDCSSFTTTSVGGISWDTVNNQIIIGENIQKINVSDNSFVYGTANSVVIPPTAKFKTKYNEDLQYLLVGQSSSVGGGLRVFKANKTTIIEVGVYSGTGTGTVFSSDASVFIYSFTKQKLYALKLNGTSTGSLKQYSVLTS